MVHDVLPVAGTVHPAFHDLFGKAFGTVPFPAVPEYVFCQAPCVQRPRVWYFLRARCLVPVFPAYQDGRLCVRPRYGTSGAYTPS